MFSLCITPVLYYIMYYIKKKAKIEISLRYIEPALSEVLTNSTYHLLPHRATVCMTIVGIILALPDTARSNINHSDTLANATFSQNHIAHAFFSSRDLHICHSRSSAPPAWWGFLPYGGRARSWEPLEKVGRYVICMAARRASAWTPCMEKYKTRLARSLHAVYSHCAWTKLCQR